MVRRALLCSAVLVAASPSVAAANVGAGCNPQGGLDVTLSGFVAGRTISAWVRVGDGPSVPVVFTGPRWVVAVPGPVTTPWRVTAGWDREQVTVAGAACTDGAYSPPIALPPAVSTPAPAVPVVPSESPVVAPPTVTAVPVVVVTSTPRLPGPDRPHTVRRWPAVPCRKGRVWGRTPNRVVFSCRPKPRRVPAVTG